MRPEDPVSKKVMVRTGFRVIPKDTLPMGGEEEDLVFLCVSAGVGT